MWVKRSDVDARDGVFRWMVPGMTYSLLVRDCATGALGAAVASRFFAVGAMCIHVEGGVAALSTQALVNPMYAVQAMPRLRAGEPADAMLASLGGAGPGAPQRQFHIIDAAGRIAQHTGPDCVTWSGHARGRERVGCRQHAGRDPAVVQRMVEAYLGSTGSLTERLITRWRQARRRAATSVASSRRALKVCSAIRIRISISALMITPIRSRNCAGCIVSAWSALPCSAGSFRAGTAEWGTLDRAVRWRWRADRP